jgi:hypothetical protein
MWPAYVLRRFARIPAAVSDAHFIAPYDILLYMLFPASTDFVVAPRPPSSSLESTFILYDADPNKSVLILQPNVPGNLRYRFMREASDPRIRARMTKLYHSSHLKPD